MEEVKYKFTATGRTGQREVFPQNGNTLSVSWEKDDENPFFRKKLKGKMLFANEDFKWLYSFERSQYRCDPIILLVEKKCGSLFSEFFVARLLLNNGDWDVDQCVVSMEAEVEDKYTCYSDNKDKELNLFSYVSSSQVVKLVQGDIENISCSGGGADVTQDCGLDLSQGWVITSYYSQTGGIPDNPQGDVPSSNNFQITYSREVVQSMQTLSAPWIPLGGGSYARPPALYGYTSYSGQDYFGYNYKIAGSVDHGMKLKDVFQVFLTQSCYGYILKSDFFQWNPDVLTNINYVTGQLSTVLNLVMIQKSDVKRPDTTNNANQANLTFEKLLNDICKLFNLKWDIDEDNRFIIEHVSFFQKGVGFNLIGRRDFRLRSGTNKYSYDIDNMPRRELFQTMDDKSMYGDFKGTPIVYNNSCVGKGDQEEKAFVVENFMTDVTLCLNNPSSENSVVGDEGFVLFACDEENNVLSEETILGGNFLNNTLSWAHLHFNFWRHERVFNRFSMNNTPTNALSVIPTKKQVKIDVSVCCGDLFDPEELVTTELGNGQVSEATFALFNENLSITLLYPSDEGLITNDPPVAVNDDVITFAGLTIDIDVLANDTDSDGIINPSSIEVLFSGSNGVASVINNKVRYTPNSGYSGNEVLVYRVKDNWGEYSNNAQINITIKPGSPLPVAGDDTFQIGKNKILTVGNVLSNDTGDGTLTAIPETKATLHGNVQIFENGGFVYTPANDFVGVDSFEYTLKDGNNNTDTGNATINVFETLPVFVKLISSNEINSNLVESCNGSQALVGSKTTKDLKVYFYSDNGVTPLNLDGYNIEIKFNNNSSSTGTPPFPSPNDQLNNGDFSVLATGAQMDIQLAFITNMVYNGCQGTNNYNYIADLTLLPDPAYTVI